MAISAPETALASQLPSGIGIAPSGRRGEPSSTVRILGVDVRNETMATALALLARSLAGPAATSLFFVNAHTLNLAAADPGYRRLLGDGDLVFGDGTGVRWAAACRGVRMKANLNGTDVVPGLLSQSTGLRCYLLGGSRELVTRAAACIERDFEGCTIAGAHHGYVDARSSKQVVDEINRSGADLLLVGMGNPLQEQWIARYRSRLQPRLCIAVGGLFAYWAGELDRAPGWMRRLGIEWLHILRRHPHKLRRYLVGNPLFLWRMLGWLPVDRIRRQAASLSQTAALGN